MEEIWWFSANEVCLTSRAGSNTRLKNPHKTPAWALCQCGRGSDRDGEVKTLAKYWTTACSKILGQRISWPELLQKTGQNMVNLWSLFIIALAVIKMLKMTTFSTLNKFHQHPCGQLKVKCIKKWHLNC